MHLQRRGAISLHSRSVILAMFAALSALWPALAPAAQFGELDVTSPLGAPLRASFSVYPDAGESLNERCLRAVTPVGDGYPVLAGVRLSVAGAAGDGLRLEVGAPSVGQVAVRFAVAADCGAGKSVREYVVLALPASSREPAVSARSGNTWVLAPGETPAGLAHTLFPNQPALQRRLLSAIAEMNPSLGIDEGTGSLPAGTPIVMPDWKDFAVPRRGTSESTAQEPSAFSAQRLQKDAKPLAYPVVERTESSVALPHRHRMHEPQEGAFFRLARTLSLMPQADEQLREILRLEYRLLAALNDQLAMMRPAMPDGAADTGRPPQLAAQSAGGPVLRIDVAPDVGRNPAAVAPATAPSHPPARENSSANPGAHPNAHLIAEPGAADDDGRMYYVAAVCAALLAGALILHRRRRGAVLVPTGAAIHEGETLILDHPPAAPGPAVIAAAGDGFSSEPLRWVAQVPESDMATGQPSGMDANPVMELAEIMLSFGRLQGAAQTLQEYIEANPKEALQPWIKLLEIYRDGGLQREYEALAARLNGIYNVEVQRWDSARQSDGLPKPVSDRGREFSRVFTLEELPHVRDRLVAEWGKPACLDYLHHLLRDNRDGRRNGFTLPVIQEILFLIDVLVAREAP